MRLLPPLLSAAILTTLPLSAQVPLIPSLTPEQTRAAVFETFRPAKEPQSLQHPRPLANFRLHLEFRLPDQSATAAVQAGTGEPITLNPPPDRDWHVLELRAEMTAGSPGFVEASIDGKASDAKPLSGSGKPGGPAADGLRFDRDFTAMVQFRSEGEGALFSFCRPEKWEPDAKMVGLRDGRLFFDIGWLGEITSRRAGLNDGKVHTAVLRLSNGRAQFFIDGRPDSAKDGMLKPDAADHTFQTGRGSGGFLGDLTKGAVSGIRYWERALNDSEAKQLSSGDAGSINTPMYQWTGEADEATFPRGIPGIPVPLSLTISGGAEIRNAWVQPLDSADHAALIRGWNAETLAEGARIY